MSEIEQANGIEIPVEVIEEAAKARSDAFLYEGGWDTLHPISKQRELERGEIALRAALNAWGATVEDGQAGGEDGHGGRERRVVTPWREVP